MSVSPQYKNASVCVCVCELEQEVAVLEHGSGFNQNQRHFTIGKTMKEGKFYMR